MIVVPSSLSHPAGFRPTWAAPRPPTSLKSAFLSWLICWRRTTASRASATSIASTRCCLGNLSAARTHIDQVLARRSRLKFNTIGSDQLLNEAEKGTNLCGGMPTRWHVGVERVMLLIPFRQYPHEFSGTECLAAVNLERLGDPVTAKTCRKEAW